MKSRTHIAQKATWRGFIINLFLSIGKLMAGIIGHSTAMIADAVHSFSDSGTDIVVLGFVRVSERESDQNHKYGHGKFETFATLLISFALLFIGIGICWSGIQNIIKSLSGQLLVKPSNMVLAAAFISIIIKEWLYQYTLKVGKSINNQAVIANAWHHRSDALSSIGTFLGVGGAIFLGEEWRILDPMAGMIVSLLIIHIAIKIGLPSAKELMEAALPDEIENEILLIVNKTPGVKGSHRLKTRKIGNIYAIDIHIKMDGELSLTESHDIATVVEQKLYKKFGNKTHINIHMEPYQ
ncbi:MAG: cation transporter [Bacteroidales bacterium]|nr:cation transporter [Bacteroidales bacterium]